VTQKELARRTGSDRSNISKYERGKTVPRPETVEDILAALDVPRPSASSFAVLDRLLAESPPAGQNLPRPRTPDPATRAELLRGIDQTVEQMIDLALVNVGLSPATPAEAPSRVAPLPASRTFCSPALCLWLCEESEKVAADDADEARILAEAARTVARRLRRTEPYNRFLTRLEGRTEGSLANAWRVAGDHASADEAFARARLLWKAGVDHVGSLSEAHMLHLEASFRRDQGRFSAALRLHSEALQKARREEAGTILLNQSATQVQMGDYQAALVTLAQAEPQLDGARQPRHLFGLKYNRAMSLCRLARAGEAEPVVREARRLADQLGNGLDLVRTRFLEGMADAGLGRTEAAIEKLEQVCNAFDERGHPYDFALVGLDLALLYREQGRWADIRKLADRMVGIFHERQIHRETIAAVILFKEAAEKEAVTVELVRRLQEYLKQAQAQPGVSFEAEAEGGRRA
jgi:transcriptional regulator with XRE-family HTH domain